ncbi:hypothetical protein SMC58_002766 [Cronobacter dublinensis]|nr:hypothetical protein [Cronobacter dublinensis]
MSTISNEIAQVARAALDYIDALPPDVVARLPTMPGFDRDWAENALRKERERAEPAGYRKLFTCSSCGAEGLDEPLESRCHCNGDGARWLEGRLYTAPPAPPVAVPVVPTEMTKRRACKEYSGRIEVIEAYRNGFNACRAAMLAAPGKQVAENETTSQQFESLAGKAVGGSEGFECTPVADLYELLTKCGECYDYTTSAKVAADWIKEGYSAREYVKLDRLQEALIFAPPEPCK